MKNESGGYILVLKDGHYCKSCYEYTSFFGIAHFCVQCRKHTFDFWSSGNDDIDKIIQSSQLNNEENILQWIPFSNFKIVNQIGRGGFASEYKAEKTGHFDTNDYSQTFALKYCDNVSDLLNEVYRFIIENGLCLYIIFNCYLILS